MTRRVLVTGATTLLGRRLLAVLARDPAVARVVAVGPGRAPPDLDPAVAWAPADLTRERDLRSLLFGPARDEAIDTVVHLAAHRRASDGGSRIRRLNVEATRQLVHLAERHPTIRRLVHRSHAEIYRVRARTPDVLDEDTPLALEPETPQWVRDRVEADLTVCTRMGLAPLRIAVLRMAEILAPDVGSQLWDFLGSRVCVRPLGFDPMLNLLSVEDAAEALRLAVGSDAQGVFNVPGADTLPLSEAIRKAGRAGVPLPGLTMGPLYALRRLALGADFRWDLNHWRFHYSAVLGGERAARELGFVPRHPLRWTGDASTSPVMTSA